MTKKQEMAIETLKEKFFEYFSYGAPEKHEIKEFSVKESGDSMYVYIETGLIGDEGTAAELYARSNTRVFVGPRGGYYNFRPSSGKKCVLKLHQAAYWGFHCDRKHK